MEIYCNGVNHSDFGKEVQCKKCGQTIVRREDGRTFNIRNYTTYFGNDRRTYSCYMKSTYHVCDEQNVKVFQNDKARRIAAGEMIPGQAVVVARGRKFPKGTEGEITWVGESDFGARARVQPTDGEAFFIALKNLDPKNPVAEQLEIGENPNIKIGEGFFS